MRDIRFYLMALLLSSLCFTGCKKKGCTDPLAVNYDDDAEKNKGCEYPNFTLYLLKSDADSFANHGVKGFILKTLGEIPEDLPKELSNVNEYISISDHTSSIPECGGGVWSYYEADGDYYYDCLVLYAVTDTDTTWTQFVTPHCGSQNPWVSKCTRDGIFYP